MINVQRSTNKINKNNSDKQLKSNILIMDTAADQCTCGGPAWHLLHDTGEKVQCNGYLKGTNGFYGPTLPIVSAITYVELQGREHILLIMNQACFYDDPDQDESLCLPFQAETHGVTFNLTPRDRLDTAGNQGEQKMIIEGTEIPFDFDGRKMYINIRCPSKEELDLLEIYELTSPEQFIPENDKEKQQELINRRNIASNVKQIFPGGHSLQRWKKCLAMAPDDIIRKTFRATTQLQTNVEDDNRMVGRRHFKSRFPALKERRVNDMFYSDTFFPSEKSIDGNNCSQLFIGKNTDFMYVQPMRTESNSFQALQDFSRKVGLPRCIKTDNASTEIGEKWTTFCRANCIDTKYTEPHTPWQNKAEHGICDLSTMVKRCMRTFNVPLSRHSYCQKWCADVRNHLASRKLKWCTPQEKLTGNTPDISVFRFHFWEQVEYFDSNEKQPHDGWKPARFLGIAWDSGDAMTYIIEPITKSRGRSSILVRSTLRRLQNPEVPSSDNSGEILTRHEDEQDQLSEPEHYFDSDKMKIDDDPVSEITNENELELNEQLQNISDGNEEDYEFHHINSHTFENGILVFNVELYSGKNYDIPFNLFKKDRPIEVAQYIKNNVVEQSRNGFHVTWAKRH